MVGTNHGEVRVLILFLLQPGCKSNTLGRCKAASKAIITQLLLLLELVNLPVA